MVMRFGHDPGGVAGAELAVFFDKDDVSDPVEGLYGPVALEPGQDLFRVGLMAGELTPPGNSRRGLTEHDIDTSATPHQGSRLRGCRGHRLDHPPPSRPRHRTPGREITTGAASHRRADSRSHRPEPTGPMNPDLQRALTKSHHLIGTRAEAVLEAAQQTHDPGLRHSGRHLPTGGERLQWRRRAVVGSLPDH